MSAQQTPFLDFLFLLRRQDLKVGLTEWMGFMQGLEKGLATDLDSLYHFGRAVLCRSETEYDQYDVAFADAFRDAELSPEARKKLEEWLAVIAERPEGEWEHHDHQSAEELWQAFQDTLREQRERHQGGNRWIGTGGRSPYGHSGKGAQGVRMGGGGGGRQAVAVAEERQWANYRTDRTLDVRDLKMALRALRNLAREGEWELDLDETIDATCHNAGDIQLVDRRARANRVHLVLLMDAGGSMAPHYDKVSKLFSAATQLKTFKTFQHYSFHNCVYRWLYHDIEQLDRVPTSEVLDKLTPNHRLIFVGDASMAPYELFSAFGWPAENAQPGIDWLRRFRQRSPASIWLNPDPKRYWNHPTVSAIGRIFEMYPLTVDGLQDAVKKLRAPI